MMHHGRLLATAPPASIRADYPSLEEAMIARILEADEDAARTAFKA